MNNENNNLNEVKVENQESGKKTTSKHKNGKFFSLEEFLKGVICAIVIASVFFAGYLTHYYTINPSLRSIEFLLDTYEKYYYDKVEKDLVHSIAEGILDPYSGYYTAEEYKEYQKNSQGVKVGYGLGLKELTISSIAGNSPAEHAGIKTGGVVCGYKLSTANEFTEATDAEDFTDFLEANTKDITLKIDYNGQVEEFKLKKAEYNENYVYYTDKNGSYRFETVNKTMQLVSYENDEVTVGDGWGYIRITAFNGLKDGTLGSAGQFDRAMALFKENGNKKLIIDLRSNGGGYLSILAKMAAHLCDSDGLKEFPVACARYPDGKLEYFNATKNLYDQYGFESIVVLANANSASASEAFIGALLDYDTISQNNIVKVVLDGAVVDGATVYKTYGKGIMQSTYTNALTGEAVKLTTAEVLWPLSKKSIHYVGITTKTDFRVYENTTEDAIGFAQTL